MGNTLNLQLKQKSFVIPEWPDYKLQRAHPSFNLLLGDDIGKQPPDTSLENVEQKSEKFPIPFPIDTVRCNRLASLVSKEILERNINSTYPVLHEHVLALYVNFLQHKRKYGYAPERELYANMSLLKFIDRLLEKRAVSFMSMDDEYYLLDGTKGCGRWETIGKHIETEQLNLQKCLSYEELKLSAFLSLSSYTVFINDGNRSNRGLVQKTGVETEGIIIGLIGARFEKPQVMEYQDIIITKEQNPEDIRCGMQHAPCSRSLFSVFYGEIYISHTEALKKIKREPNRFIDLGYGEIFDNKVYCKRIALSIDTLLLEANQRAKERRKMAFIHVVGIGLGVWKLSPHQNTLFLDTFAKRIQCSKRFIYAGAVSIETESCDTIPNLICVRKNLKCL